MRATARILVGLACGLLCIALVCQAIIRPQRPVVIAHVMLRSNHLLLVAEGGRLTVAQQAVIAPPEMNCDAATFGAFTFRDSGPTGSDNRIQAGIAAHRHGERSWFARNDVRALGNSGIVMTFRAAGAPAWALALLLAAPPALIVRRWLKRRRDARRGLCLRCGYDLRATPGRCPECGADALARAAVS